jgi:hypothetical protein
MLLILHKGELRQRQVGAVPPDVLLRWAEKALS